MIKTFQKRKSGFSLIESLIYITILSIMAVLVISIILVIAKSYNNLNTTKSINNSAIVSFERITRDIKLANDVLVINSVFDTHPGKLVLQAGATTTEFYLNQGVLRVKENMTDTGPLTQQKSFIDNLVFRLFDNGVTKAVRIEMTISVAYKGATTTKSFYTTSTLRN